MKIAQDTLRSIAADIGLQIEKLSNDGIDGWDMNPKEVIAEIWDHALLLEKIAKGESLCSPDSNSVMEFVIARYEWEYVDDSECYEASDLIPLLVAISNDKPIGCLYYSDVVKDEFIFEPQEARDADPNGYVMTKEFYEFGKSWFESSENFKEEFEEIYEISWSRAMNEWADQYVSKKWVANDWASYMLDRLADSYSAGCYRKFAILKMT
jgi:hypothetical protein